MTIRETKNHAAFIWSVADLLRGTYRQSDYGKSGGRYTQSARAEGLDISRSVPSRLPLVERPRGDTLSACHDLEET